MQAGAAALIEPRLDSGRAEPPRADRGDTAANDLVDMWGRDSFPASDPPANW